LAEYAALLVGKYIYIFVCNSDSNDLVSYCEAQNVAEKMGCLYQETSAQTGEHVADAFESAVKLGHTRRKEASESRRSKIISDSFDSTWIPPMSEYKYLNCFQSPSCKMYRVASGNYCGSVDRVQL